MLEEVLGLPLFERVRQRLKLTSAGEILVALAVPCIAASIFIWLPPFTLRRPARRSRRPRVRGPMTDNGEPPPSACAR